MSTENREALTENTRLLESRIKVGSVAIPSDGGDSATLRSLKINALISLWKDHKSSCALVLFQLLPQRSEFETEDREVLTLLSLYAGPCLRTQERA